MAGRFMDEMPGMSFGHAGTIVEGKEDTAAEKIARLARGRDRGRRARSPRSPTSSSSELGAERRVSAATALFIDVEVDDAGRRATRQLAAKLAEVCPVDIFAAADDGELRDRRGEPRRVRALRPVPRRRAAGTVTVLKLYDGGAELERAA